MEQLRMIQEAEYCHHVDLDQAVGLSEADEVLLMELLEDSPFADEDDADRLSHVMRSLEAEIGGATVAATVDGESTAGPPSGMLDEMLVDLEYWPEVLPVGHGVGGSWYVYMDTEAGECVVAGYEFGDPHYCYADQDSVEQEYSPLWE